MLDTHHSHHGKSIPSLILEVAMIVVGVFLGLAACSPRRLARALSPL